MTPIQQAELRHRLAQIKQAEWDRSTAMFNMPSYRPDYVDPQMAQPKRTNLRAAIIVYAVSAIAITLLITVVHGLTR